MTSEIRISTIDDAILEIVLARAEHGNALTDTMSQAIAQALATLDPKIRVVHLRAEGADFCTGRKAAMPPAGSNATALDLRAAISDPVLGFYAMLREIPVPLVISVQGRAAGVGCALAALGDVAIAAASATFQVPEMERDIAPTLVMDALTDRIPRAALARLVLTRDAIAAPEAANLGLVAMVVDDEALEGEADRIVRKLAQNSVPTVRAVKSFLTRAPETSSATRRELAALLNSVATAERYR